MFNNQYGESIIKILRYLYKWKGVELIEGSAMVDQIHLVVSIPPKYIVSSIMGYLIGKSALMIFDRHANLKYIASRLKLDFTKEDILIPPRTKQPNQLIG